MVTVLTTATALSLTSFFFYAPLTFHRPLTHAPCERCNLLQHIVDCMPCDVASHRERKEFGCNAERIVVNLTPARCTPT
jgi:hypothetical protein